MRNLLVPAALAEHSPEAGDRRRHACLGASTPRQPRWSCPRMASLGSVVPGSVVILDDAHDAVLSSGDRYRIESRFTRAVRGPSERFEHRLLLSATSSHDGQRAAEEADTRKAELDGATPSPHRRSR